MKISLLISVFLSYIISVIGQTIFSNGIPPTHLVPPQAIFNRHFHPSANQISQVPPIPILRRGVPHFKVVQNAEQESTLPAHLKNPFYKNPRLVSALAHESLITPEEDEVFERDTDKVNREHIYQLLKGAGLLR